jgi:hypothetical protein
MTKRFAASKVPSDHRTWGRPLFALRIIQLSFLTMNYARALRKRRSGIPHARSIGNLDFFE